MNSASVLSYSIKQAHFCQTQVLSPDDHRAKLQPSDGGRGEGSN
jgi:hypothetical protein